MNSLKGKRILITSYSYAAFGGAELNAVELADQLVKFGMKPTFFSYDTRGPLKKYIEDRFETTVITDQINRLVETEDETAMGVTKFDINDYDYIWIGGNTIPVSIINQINSATRLPKFIFIHMSPLIAFPLDAPLMPRFEKEIASSILSISRKTTTDNIQRILGKDIKVEYWKNPVPIEFKDLKERNGTLKRIAVISSSHPSQEIMDIKSRLESKGIIIDYIGKFNNNIQVVDAEFYDKYDLIIGIGKNSRYSLVSGVPIYIYGRFGGPGYLNNKNLNTSESHNFSGRGFDKKEADEIAHEIISGYEDALHFHEEYREQFVKELSIDNVTRELFERLETQKHKTTTFDQPYISWLVTTQINMMQRINSMSLARVSVEKIKILETTVGQLKGDISKLRENITSLNQQNTSRGQTIQKQEQELRNVYHSKSWTVTKPMRLALQPFKKIYKKLKS